MIFDGVLTGTELDRAEQTLRKLVRHDVSRWALTGGLATEIHLRRTGAIDTSRCLNDIDFIVESFDCIPETLGRNFLMRHVHPNDPPGKTLLQCVNPETRVRVDVFHASPKTMDRGCDVSFAV